MDDINAKLDELAALLECWQRQRASDYTPRTIRAAALLVIREIAALQPADPA